MKHRSLQMLVSVHADGMTNEHETKIVRAHLADCSDCRRWLAGINAMRATVHAEREVSLHRDFARRVVHAVEERDHEAEGWLGIEPSARNAFFVVALFVLILLACTSILGPPKRPAVDPITGELTADSTGSHLLLQQGEISKNDLFFAAMIK